jgi:LAO/AO transport system kinase
MAREGGGDVALLEGVRRGDRAAIGRALTLVESNASRDRARAESLLLAALPHAGRSIRIGLTGVPGAGKSTFLEALGTALTAQGKRVAVLAIDPTSTRSGGSILGDKTRMPRLSRDPLAFIRPSPSGGALGGVARKTREAIVICEASGADVVIVETVGVGQSEIAVASMVDTFVLLWLPSSGDELQGIKRGIVELADVVVVNKADGERVTAAERARAELSAALRYLAPTAPGWSTPVLTASALEGKHIDATWTAILAHRDALGAGLAEKRREQDVAAMWTAADSELVRRAHASRSVRALADSLERDVASGKIPPAIAAARIVDAYDAG